VKDEDVAPMMGLILSSSSRSAFEAASVVMSQHCIFV